VASLAASAQFHNNTALPCVGSIARHGGGVRAAADRTTSAQSVRSAARAVGESQCRCTLASSRALEPFADSYTI
jgi:hypothetical protein